MARGDFIERERMSGIAYLADLHATARSIYQRPLAHDHLPPETLSAVFSDTNPYVPFYDQVMREFLEARTAYSALGYIGMAVKGGRAELYQRRQRRERRLH